MAAGVDASVESGADAVLRVQLLGPFAIHRGGHPLMLPASRKLRALFGHLALAAAAGRPRRLCELLWEGPDDPRGELRGPLSELRQAIDTPARPRLITGDDRVRLDLDGCVVDAIEVEQAIAAILKKRLIWPRRRRCSRPRGITAASGTCTASRPPTIFRRGIFSEWRCGSIRPSRVPARHCRSPISSAFQGWGRDARQPAIDRAFEAAGQSLLVDDRDPAAHWAMGRALYLRRRDESAIAELERSIDRSPKFSLAHYALAFVHSQAGDPVAAITASDRARVLSPFDSLLFGTLASRAMALARMGRYAESADWAV